MKKFLLLILTALMAGTIFAADFEMRIIDVRPDRATIAIPIDSGGTPSFQVLVDGELQIGQTSMWNSKIDAKTVTTTVKYDESYERHFIEAKEIAAAPAYNSAYLTITPKPIMQEVMQDRDSYVYEDKLLYQTWEASTSVGNYVVNTTFNDYALHLLEIIVGGDQIGYVTLLVDGTAVRRYHYIASQDGGQIFSAKLPVPQGETFQVQLTGGTAGTHTVSISAEIVK